MPPAQGLASKQTGNAETSEEEPKSESGCSPGIHELASNGEAEGRPERPIKRRGRTISSAPAARTRKPLTDPSNDC